MPHLHDDQPDAFEHACRLAAQAELLALNAAIEAARGGTQAGEFAALAREAAALARQGHEAVLRQQRLQQAVRAAGEVLDEGLAVALESTATGLSIAALTRLSAHHLSRGADHIESIARRLH